MRLKARFKESLNLVYQFYWSEPQRLHARNPTQDTKNSTKGRSSVQLVYQSVQPVQFLQLHSIYARIFC